MFKKILLPLSFIILLTGCTTFNDLAKEAHLPHVVCNPPTALTQKFQSLPAVPSGNMAEQDAVKNWIGDIGQYNNLVNKDDSLVDWVHTDCN